MNILQAFVPYDACLIMNGRLTLLVIRSIQTGGFAFETDEKPCLLAMFQKQLVVEGNLGFFFTTCLHGILADRANLKDYEQRYRELLN